MSADSAPSDAAAGASGLLVQSALQAARLTEQSVGICEYVNTHKGFRGTLKYRYTDFLVNEVDPDKKVARFTDPSPDSADAGRTDVAMPQPEGAQAGSYMDFTEEERAKALSDIIGEDQGKKVLDLEGKVSKDAAGTTEALVLEPETDKKKRTDVHGCIRKYFPLLCSDSTKVGDNTCVRIYSSQHNEGNRYSGDRPAAKRQKGPGGKPVPQGTKPAQQYLKPPSDKKFVKVMHFCHKLVCIHVWQSTSLNTQMHPDSHTQFTLLKENLDTMSCINMLAHNLGVPQKLFAYAGTKDKRGITCQRVTAHNLSAGKVATLNRSKGVKGVRVGDFEYCKEPLRLGDLYGNRFSILLRDVEAPYELIRQSCEGLSERGFINYYGKQRFGSSSIGTHEVGRAILQGKFDEAARLIVCPRDGEKDEATKVRGEYEKDGDVEKALKAFPRWMHCERSLLEGYRKHGKQAHETAIGYIPRNMRLMYVHAYQSALFNKMASERVRLYGCDRAVEGDLVLGEGEQEDTSVVEGAAEGFVKEEGEEQKELGGDDVEGRDKEWTMAHPKKVKALTAEEAARTSVFDIVLPLAGRSIVYPGHDIGKRYLEVLKEDGLDDLKGSHLSKEYRLTGDYRKVFARPEDMEWELIRYTDPKAEIQATEFDGPRNRDPDKPHLRKQPAAEEGAQERRALRLTFTLKSSAYATMCLREILKDFMESAAWGLGGKEGVSGAAAALSQASA